MPYRGMHAQAAEQKRPQPIRRQSAAADIEHQHSVERLGRRFPCGEIPVRSRHRTRCHRAWKSRCSSARRPACHATHHSTSLGSKPQTSVAISRNCHHAAGPGGRSRVRQPARGLDDRGVRHGTRPPAPPTARTSRRVSRSNNECIATSVVVSQKNPTCLTSTKPARPHRIPALKASPAAWTIRASRHKARPAPRRRHPSGGATTARPGRRPDAGRVFLTSDCTALNPSAARRRISQAMAASSRTSHCPPIRTARNSVTCTPPAPGPPVRALAEMPARNMASAKRRADHRQRGREFPRHRTTTGTPRAKPAIPLAARELPASPRLDAATESRTSGGVRVAAAIALSKSIRSSKVHRRGSLAMVRIPAGFATDGNAGKPGGLSAS